MREEPTESFSVEIETARLLLRAPELHDASAMAELANDAGVATMTASEPNFFTPRRRPSESRPLRDEPPAFL